MSDPIDDAARAAMAGEPIVMPTDTVYGIATRPDDPAATSKLFEAKGRPRDLEIPVLVAAVRDAQRIAVFDERAETLVGRFWPGALTIVLPRTEAARDWYLGGDPATVGVRMPHHPMALAVLARAGPLAVTSANRSGKPTPSTCEGLHRVFGDLVSVYLCEADPLEGRPSTVVDLAHGRPRILREGGLAATVLSLLEGA